MGLRDSFIKALGGTPGVVNAPAPAPLEEQPNPQAWALATFGPGYPVRPTVQPLEEHIPREFDFPVMANSTIVPRSSYGLMPFPALAEAYESISEVKLAVHILCREMAVFLPRIEDSDGNDVGPDDQFAWFCERPDRRLPWEVWMQRFLKSALIFDAGCLYHDMREERLRYTDGSTIFPFIDQHGETPQGEVAAFAQVIKGVPFQWFTNSELWYHPLRQRYNAPYGESAIELAWSDILVLANIKGFELAHYRQGNMPEGWLAPPDTPNGMSPSQVSDWEQAFNARMSSGPAERNRIRVLPGQWKYTQTKKPDFPEHLYYASFNNVGLAFGVPQSEFGKTPGSGLGGKGFAEMSQSTFFRMGLNPMRQYVKGACNDFLLKILAGNRRFELAFPTEDDDPKDLSATTTNQFINGLMTLNEARASIGLDPVKGGDKLLIIRNGTVVSISDFLAGNTADETAGGDAAIDDQPDATTQDTSLAQRVIETGSSAPTTSSSGSTGTSTRSSDSTSTTDSTVSTTKALMADIERTALKTPERKLLTPPLRKMTGVTPTDDMYYMAPVSAAGTVDIPSDHHANEVCLVALTPENMPSQPAIWKPFSGENSKLIARMGGPQYVREEAAYILDRALTFYLVPVAFIHTIDGSPGAVIMWAKDAKGSNPVSTYSPFWVERAATLDYISGQGDRHTGNWLTHPVDTRRPILIDNGLAFPSMNLPVYSPWVSAMQATKLSKDVLGRVKLAANDTGMWDAIRALVGEDACSLAENRVQAIMDTSLLLIDYGQETVTGSTGTTLSDKPVGHMTTPDADDGLGSEFGGIAPQDD